MIHQTCRKCPHEWQPEYLQGRCPSCSSPEVSTTTTEAMRPLTTFSEVIDWADREAKNDTTNVHIMFNLGTDDGKAVVHIVDDRGYTAEVVTAFTWRETFLMRKITKYGSNHQFSSVPLSKLAEIMSLIAIHFGQNQGQNYEFRGQKRFVQPFLVR